MANTHVHVVFGGPFNAGKAVTVKNRDNTTASIFDSSDGSLANPVTADSQGAVDFYAPAGIYNLVSGTESQQITVGSTDIPSQPPTDGPVVSTAAALGEPGDGNTAGTIVGSVEVFDAAGTSLGFLAVYDAITTV